MKKKRRARHVEKKKKKKGENLGRAFVEKFFSPSFPPNLGGKKMWAREKTFSLVFQPSYFTSPNKQWNSIFYPIFHSLYFHPKWTEPKDLFGYRLLLKTENWKYYSKIIFKYVNSAVGLSFKVIFAEFHTCESHEQCTKPTKKNVDAQSNANALLSRPSLILTSKYNFASCALASLLALIWTLICSISLIK